MKEIAELLKIFIEKHLIPTLLSVVLTILTYAFIPYYYWLLIRIGTVWFYVLVFCGYFLLISLVIWIGKCIVRAIRKIKSNIVHTKYVENETKEALKQLWCLVDKMSQADRDYIINFIESGNNPIEVEGEMFYDSDSLFNPRFVDSTTIRKPKAKPLDVKPEQNEGHVRIPVEAFIFSQPTKQYKLKDDFYNILKYSYSTYGRISNFDNSRQDEDAYGR